MQQMNAMFEGLQNPMPSTSSSAYQQIQSKQSTSGIIDVFSRNISEFHYDPDNNITFEAWYSRYQDLFTKYAAKLEEGVKVRLLLRRMSSIVHERYVNFILPKATENFNFDETVATLKKNVW